MDDYLVVVQSKRFKIPYRIYDDAHLSNPKLALLCNESRHHDGYRREEAIKELLLSDLTSREIPYVFLALADYVFSISILPTASNPNIKKAMRDFIKENEFIARLIEAKTISYWNEYYRNKFTAYTEYPPYAYLQKLK